MARKLHKKKKQKKAKNMKKTTLLVMMAIGISTTSALSARTAGKAQDKRAVKKELLQQAETEEINAEKLKTKTEEEKLETKIVEHHKHIERLPIATPKQVDVIIANMQTESFDDGKFKYAQMGTQLFGFTVSDLNRIAKLFTFDDKRKAFLTAAYENCPDKHNYELLTGVFTFKSSAEDMLKQVRR